MRSDQVTKGPDRAPHRSLFYAAGFTDEELQKPLIGVVSAQSDIIPGHTHLSKLADAVKAGVYAAGGTPVVVPAIGVCDGIVMGHRGMHYSLASRELIADSVETLAAAHCFDGLVLIPNCDKIVPGMVMAALRLNIPAIVCSGGPMLRAGPVRQGERPEDHGAGGEEHPSPGCRHHGDAEKRHHRGHGSGLLHQQRPAPAGHRPRGEAETGSEAVQ